jgi:hypothetical protein
MESAHTRSLKITSAVVRHLTIGPTGQCFVNALLMLVGKCIFPGLNRAKKPARDSNPESPDDSAC